MSGSFRNSGLEQVHFGPGAIGRLADELDARGVRRAIVVTGQSIAGNAALLGRVRDALGGRIASIFSDTRAHVPRPNVITLIDHARAERADGLISFGGGSTNDSMKAAAWGLADGWRQTSDLDRCSVKFEYPDRITIPSIAGEALPTFAIATTLSAGEFSDGFGVTDTDRGEKDIFRDRQLSANAVILDPELTLATPERLWLSSGIKAVDHCVEALLSPRSQPISDALAGKALVMLHRNLKLSKQDPANLEARTQCLVAAWLSFFSITNVGVGLSHGIGHQLGALCGVPHGETSCVMLPHAMTFNRPETLQKQAGIANILGIATRDVQADAVTAQQAIATLIRDELALPWRLRDVGVERPQFAKLAHHAIRDLVVSGNPRKLSSEAEIVELLEAAW